MINKLRCESCGARYDYAQDETCPKCGAYNSPRDRQTHTCSPEELKAGLGSGNVRHYEVDSPHRSTSSNFEKSSTDMMQTWQQYAANRGKKNSTASPRATINPSDFRSNSEEQRSENRTKKKLKPEKVAKVIILLVFVFPILMNIAVSLFMSVFDSGSPFEATPEIVLVDPSFPLPDLPATPDNESYEELNALYGNLYISGDLSGMITSFTYVTDEDLLAVIPDDKKLIAADIEISVLGRPNENVFISMADVFLCRYSYAQSDYEYIYALEGDDEYRSQFEQILPERPIDSSILYYITDYGRVDGMLYFLVDSDFSPEDWELCLSLYESYNYGDSYRQRVYNYDIQHLSTETRTF